MGRKCIDLTGQKFNRLTVLYRDLNYPKTKPVHWVCKCECENIKSVDGAYLRSGKIKSCGCLRKELTKEMGKSRANAIGPRKDLTGLRFGKLRVVSLIGKNPNDSHYSYLCECDCGRQVNVLSHSLTSGNTRSCGLCSHHSLGEEKIQHLLEEHEIFYEQQKKFPTCRFPDTNSYARFDFWVDNRYLIEFDGIQHFKSNGGWNNEQQLIAIKKRDSFKNKWCKEHNIQLLRIPYTKLNSLSFQDIWIPV